MDLGLTDRVFVVSAASAGLGRATADALVTEGARVVLVARRGEVLDTAVQEYGPDRAAACPGDLNDPELARRAAAMACDLFGRLDGALISVGGPPRGRVLQVDDATWTAAFDSVFLAALRMARAVVAAATGPVALGFVLSSSVRAPLPTMAVSNGLRPGLAMLIKQMADELGPDGGRAVGLMPGSVATERLTWLYEQTPDPAGARAAAEAAIPLGRLGEPAEFGRVAAFLLSPAASYITGSMIAIDGGSLRAL